MCTSAQAKRTEIKQRIKKAMEFHQNKKSKHTKKWIKSRLEERPSPITANLKYKAVTNALPHFDANQQCLKFIYVCTLYTNASAVNNGCKFLIYYSQHYKWNGMESERERMRERQQTDQLNSTAYEMRRRRKNNRIQCAAFSVEMHNN